MTTTHTPDAIALRSHLDRAASSARLQAVLAAGTHPHPLYVDVLIDQCSIEPDFYVRDMLTWALTRHPLALTIPRLIAELGDARAQARSQALHSLSKFADPAAWAWITDDLLGDGDNEVARSAWRAAVVLAPPDEESRLAGVLASQFGRGNRDMQLSLSRALVALGDSARLAVARAATSLVDTVRTHALATEQLLDDPDESFDAAIYDARRIVAMGPDADR